MIGIFGQLKVWIMVAKLRKNYFQKLFFEYIQENLSNFCIEYEVIYFNEFRNYYEFECIEPFDYIIWEPIVASWNLDFINIHTNSIIILKNPTLLIQKISRKNPINESTAINNGFRILYMDPKDIDITNEEWKLLIDDEKFVISIDKLRRIIKPSLKNKIEIEPFKIMRNSTIGEYQVNLS
jgi:hypothetical protein